MSSEETAPSPAIASPKAPPGCLKRLFRLILWILGGLLAILTLFWLSPSLRGRALAQIVWRGGSDTRSFFIMRIEELGEPGVGSLVLLLSHEDFELRLKVVDSLGVIGPQAHSALPTLTALLDSDPDAAVKRRAAWALARIGDDKACAALAERFLTKLNKDEALAAIEGLSKVPESGLLTIILKKLSDEPATETERNELWDLRSAICEKLKVWGIKTSEVMTALETASKGQDSDVAEAARATIEALSNKQAP